MTDSIELQHELREAQGRLPSHQAKIKRYTASCQKEVASLSTKMAARDRDLDEEEEIEERYEECVREQREKGESRIRARRICRDKIVEEREASVLSRAEEARRRFLSSGSLPPSPDFPGKPAVFTIFQR